jgi:hypothetical protein
MDKQCSAKLCTYNFKTDQLRIGGELRIDRKFLLYKCYNQMNEKRRTEHRLDAPSRNKAFIHLFCDMYFAF